MGQGDDLAAWDSPDLATVLQEVIDGAGWATGNAVMLKLTPEMLEPMPADGYSCYSRNTKVTVPCSYPAYYSNAARTWLSREGAFLYGRPESQVPTLHIIAGPPPGRRFLQSANTSTTLNDAQRLNASTTPQPLGGQTFGTIAARLSSRSSWHLHMLLAWPLWRIPPAMLRVAGGCRILASICS
jgi:hypothetical protein